MGGIVENLDWRESDTPDKKKSEQCRECCGKQNLSSQSLSPPGKHMSGCCINRVHVTFLLA
jgi:hypothetical protein